MRSSARGRASAKSLPPPVCSRAPVSPPRRCRRRASVLTRILPPPTGVSGPRLTIPRWAACVLTGFPVHLGATDWRIERGAPLLGQHNDYVYGELLGLRPEEIGELRDEGVL